MNTKELLTTLEFQLSELKREKEQIPRLIKALTALGHNPSKIASAQQKLEAEMERIQSAIKELR